MALVSILFLPNCEQILVFTSPKNSNWKPDLFEASPHCSSLTHSSSAGWGRWSLRADWRQKRSRPGRRSVRSLPLTRRRETGRCRWRLLSLYTGLGDRGGERCHTHTHTHRALITFPIIWDDSWARMEWTVLLQSKQNEKHDGSIFQSCKLLMRNVKNLMTVLLWPGGSYSKYELLNFDRIMTKKAILCCEMDLILLFEFK